MAGLELEMAVREGLTSLLGVALMAGGSLLLVAWVASSRYFEVLFILAALAVLAYVAHT